MTNAILLNGLWQGALIVAMTACATICVPQGHAATRYALWFTGLLALAVVPIASVWHPAPAFATLPSPVQHTAVATARAASETGIWLLVIWFAGVTLAFLRLALSWARINQIMRNATPIRRFGTDVMSSDDVAIPIAAGVFAPMVVLPTHVLGTLDDDELDCIVQHERAHIRRMDIGANVVHRVIEACLFFNPWVYVIGRELIKEREAACDDWAVHANGHAARYASCLMKLAQNAQNARTPLLTPSAIGPKRMLMARITRLLNGKATQMKTNYFIVGANALAFGILAAALQTSTGFASVGTAVATNTHLSAKCFREVSVLDAAMPNIGQSAIAKYPNASANALVTVASDGRPTGARIVKSSGSAQIDRATIDAAMRSKYSPAMNNCKVRVGQYLFHVQTSP